MNYIEPLNTKRIFTLEFGEKTNSSVDIDLEVYLPIDDEEIDDISNKSYYKLDFVKSEIEWWFSDQDERDSEKDRVDDLILERIKEEKEIEKRKNGEF